jgi:hypothetical protein
MISLNKGSEIRVLPAKGREMMPEIRSERKVLIITQQGGDFSREQFSPFFCSIERTYEKLSDSLHLNVFV